MSSVVNNKECGLTGLIGVAIRKVLMVRRATVRKHLTVALCVPHISYLVKFK